MRQNQYIHALMINFKAKLPLELVNYLRFTGIITGNHKRN